MSIDTYTSKLVDRFLAQGNKEAATSMQAYLKDQFLCLGIKVPERRALQRAFYQAHGRPGREEWQAVVRALVGRPERELQHCGLELMYDLRKTWTEDVGTLIEWCLLQHSWWDTVDFIATKCLAHYGLAFPVPGRRLVARFVQSDDLWLKRAAIIFQNGYKKKTDEALLFQNIRLCMGIKMFFIEKAIGWALREYAKTNSEAVRAFVEAESLSKLSEKEALKHYK